jgi:hypothetical protein
MASYNVGGSTYVAQDGTVFGPAPALSHGSITLKQRNAPVDGTLDDALYTGYGSGTFGYDIAAPVAGTYRVDLHLAEMYWTRAGARVFDVALEGVVPASFNDIDVFALTGARYEALVLSATVQVTDGVLDLDVRSLVNNGILAGFSVTRLAAVPPPAVGDDAATVAEDGSVLVAVLANDEAGATLAGAGAAAGVAGPAHGTVTVQNGQVRYTPTANYFGADSFEYVARNAAGGTATARVSVQVSPVNDAPGLPALAGNTVSEAAAAGTVIGQLSATDADGDAVAFTVDDPRFAVNANRQLVVANGANLAGNGDRAVPIVITANDGHGGVTTATRTVTILDSAAPGGWVAAFNVGGGAYTSVEDGTVFAADPGPSSGSTDLRQKSAQVGGTLDDPLYTNYRTGLSFGYDVAVPASGEYQVTLYLADSFWTQAGKRVYDVRLEGAVPPQFDDIDVYARSGGRWQALELSATVLVTDGVLDLDFLSSADRALVNAFKVERLGPAADGGTAEQLHLAWTEDTATTLTVVWRLDAGADQTEVQYRAAGTSAWALAGSELRSSGTVGGELREATLRGLAADTEYEFRVRLDDGTWSKVYDARTAPEAGDGDFTAVYFADTGLIGRNDGLATGTAQVRDEIAALDPTLLLGGGDYAYFNTDKRFGTLEATIDAWFDQWSGPLSQAPFMSTYGNHEVILGEGFQQWNDRLPQPEPSFDGGRYYSYDVAGVHFVSIYLGVETQSLSAAALNWIEADIEAAKAAGAEWIIPYMHAAPYSGGTNHPDALTARNQLAPRFEDLGVDLVLSSHDQSYLRTFPLVNGSRTISPTTNVPTTSDLDTYYTESDGVIWMKTSPGGKESNLNGAFSDWQQTPPPAYVAVRDNAMHHYAQLSFDDAGSLTVEVWGVTGDGSDPVLVDDFEIIKGERPGSADLLLAG